MNFILFVFLILFFFNFLFGNKSRRVNFYSKKEFERPKNFETSLLVLASVVIKSDGYVNNKELNYVRKYFVNSYGKEKANESFKKFREVIQQPISIRQTCINIAEFMPYEARIQLIIFLFDVANSDGNVKTGEELEIRKIASYMMIIQDDYFRLSYMYDYQRTDNEYNNSTTYSKNSDYEYEILEVSKNSSNDEIKKSYRKLVKKYHPDRLTNSTDIDKKVAKEKFQKIQSAYEKIKETRGF